MKIKVLWICTSLIPRYGVMNIIRGWASRIDQSRYDVTFLYSSPDPDGVAARLQDYGLKLRNLPALESKNRLFVPGLVQLIRHLKRHQYDVVHTVFIKADILGALAARFARIPVVVSSVMGYLAVPVGGRAWKMPFYKLVYRLAHRRFDCVTAITRTTADELERDFAVPRRKLRVIYSGIELQEVPRPKRENGFTVGYVGQLIPAKGVRTLVEAVSLLQNRIPGLRLQIAGDGSGRAHLETLVERLGIPDRVMFLGFREDVPQLMASFDVFVFTSLPGFDGLPRVILEAMVQQTPVIAARTSPIEEVVVEGKTGLLFEAGDARQLADRLEAIHAQQAGTASMTEAAHEMVQSFSIDSEVRQIEAMYEQLLARRSMDSA